MALLYPGRVHALQGGAGNLPGTGGALRAGNHQQPVGDGVHPDGLHVLRHHIVPPPQKGHRAADRGNRQGCPRAGSLEELGDCVSGKPSVEDELENQRVEEAIDRFLWTLGETKRTVFIRRYWYFDSISSICRRTGFSQSKVKSMLYHTRQKLRDYLESEEIEL